MSKEDRLFVYAVASWMARSMAGHDGEPSAEEAGMP
jgi:hypothetical protein